ncbi:hypothetical protein CHARACLAT_022381 [Characodon lateralis]|uniref:Uncharacterized protein n=1 Tax=Characodon lateralis TaxID=208331 RepID=A0ABU7EVT8_9TELE|nr:hypothetical protein [Characodon lateralis]
MSYFYTLLYIYLWVFTVGSNMGPKCTLNITDGDFFTNQPLNISCHVGENLTFHVTLKNFSFISLQRNNTESKYVALCRDQHPVPLEEQDPQFEKRVETTACNEMSGNWSFTLLNLTKNDIGKYVLKNQTHSKLPIILSVTDTAEKNHSTTMPPLAILDAGIGATGHTWNQCAPAFFSEVVPLTSEDWWAHMPQEGCI